MEPILNTQVREVEHNPRTRVLVTPEAVTFRPGGGQRLMEMTPAGVESMAKFVGLPTPLAAKLRPETFGNVATELLDRKNRYSLVVKDGVITNVVKKGEYRTVNPERVLQTIERAIPDVEFHRCLILDDLATSLEVIGDKRQPVRAGDLVQAGANITFSPLGTVNPLVQSYALRLACTNGMTDNTVLREFHYGHDGGGGGGGGRGGGEGDDVWQWFRRSIRQAYGALDHIVNRYRQMIDEGVTPEHRAQVLTAMLREAKISGKDAEAVRALALENPPENRYDILNLITQATSHIIERPQAVRTAQLAAAGYAHEHTNGLECPLCHARRN
jgi:hypothetical protein